MSEPLPDGPCPIAPVMPTEGMIAASSTLVCGVFDLFVTPFLSACAFAYCGFFASMCLTAGMFPVGGLCGLVGCLLYPLGMVEILVGAVAVRNQHPASVRMLRVLSLLQVASVLCGGSLSFVIGAVNAVLLWASPNVSGYLEQDRRDW